MKPAFMMFVADQVAVRIDKITSVRALDEQDLDDTGALRRNIPTDALTEISTEGLKFYVVMPFAEVMTCLKLWTEVVGHE